MNFGGIERRASTIVVSNKNPASVLMRGFCGGELGIRTLVRFWPEHDFQSCAFDHSANSPYAHERNGYIIGEGLGLVNAIFAFRRSVFSGAADCDAGCL